MRDDILINVVRLNCIWHRPNSATGCAAAVYSTQHKLRQVSRPGQMHHRRRRHDTGQDHIPWQQLHWQFVSARPVDHLRALGAQEDTRTRHVNMFGHGRRQQQHKKCIHETAVIYITSPGSKWIASRRWVCRAEPQQGKPLHWQ